MDHQNLLGSSKQKLKKSNYRKYIRNLVMKVLQTSV